jgi:hypothetical protein
MLNKAPIFINGFSRGGTNLIMNLLASHPEVCVLSGETHEVFCGKSKRRDRKIRRLFYSPIKAAAGQQIFQTHCFETRNRVPGAAMHYIDLFFYIDKLITERNKFKSEESRYTFRELNKTRFLAKNMNGVVFASDVFSEMYPDATFIAIVRNGLAICEGHIRRGRTAEEFGRMYEAVGRKMIQDTSLIKNYHIVYFEDMISDPLAFMKKIYVLANLDISKVGKVRLQAKKSMDGDGSRQYTFGGEKDREIHWFETEAISKYIRKEVNESQMRRLSAEDRDAFLKQAQWSMEHFGYLKES